MVLLRLRRPVFHVAFVVCESARLVTIVMAGDRQNRKRNALVLLWAGHHRIVVRTRNGMLQPLLKHGRRIPHDTVVFFERQMTVVIFAHLRSPERCVSEQIGIAGNSACKREPLLGNASFWGAKMREY